MNVLSYTNAGKRQHGENHWFWAVWTGIEESPDVVPEGERRVWPSWAWNQEQPSVSGFSPSEKEARRSAWNAIRNSSPESPRAWKRPWAADMLKAEASRDKRPSFSRCNVGKDRWLWVVYDESRVYWDDEPLAHPAGATVEEIQAAYRRLARTTHPDTGGDSEEFKKVHGWYEEALSVVGVA